MRNYNNRGRTRNQRRSVPESLTDLLTARAQYKFLTCIECVAIGWIDGYAVRWRSAPLSWGRVRDFDRGGHTLYYKRAGGDWTRCPIDDFTRERDLQGVVSGRGLEDAPYLRSVYTGGDDSDVLVVDRNWQAVLRRRRCQFLRAQIVNNVGVGWRSSVIAKIACQLYDHGASQDEVACVIEASRAYQSKHGGRRSRTPGEEATKLWAYRWRQGEHDHEG